MYFLCTTKYVLHISNHTTGNIHNIMNPRGQNRGQRAFVADSTETDVLLTRGEQQPLLDTSPSPLADVPGPTYLGNIGWSAPTDSEAYYYDSGTDSDTESSVGDTMYGWQEFEGMEPEEVEQVLFGRMQKAKGMWRQYTRKPVRKVRRFFRRKGKGKGKGKRLSGKGISTYVATLGDEEYEDMFFGRGRPKGRGMGKGRRSTGKRCGKKRQPTWPSLGLSQAMPTPDPEQVEPKPVPSSSQ